MTKLHNCLATLRPQSFHNLVLCGDFNIDPQHSQNESLVHLQTDFQLVDEPTRTTNSSSTTIDLVFLSNSSSLISCAVLASLATSDYFSVQVTLMFSQTPSSALGRDVLPLIHSWLLFITGTNFWKENNKCCVSFLTSGKHSTVCPIRPYWTSSAAFILLKWLTSYLTSRLQRVVLGGVSSAWLPVKSGVPKVLF